MGQGTTGRRMGTTTMKPSLAEVAIGATDVNSLSYRELQYKCKSLKLPATGTAEVLTKRLLKAGGLSTTSRPSRASLASLRRGGGVLDHVHQIGTRQQPHAPQEQVWQV